MIRYQVLKTTESDHTAHIIYVLNPEPIAILLNPYDTWVQVDAFLQKHDIHLKYILLTDALFDTAYRVAHIKQQTGARLLGPQSFLLKLGTLPKQADQRNICGIKIPPVDRFIKTDETLDLHGI